MTAGIQAACGTMTGNPVVSLPSPFNVSHNNPAGATAALGLNSNGKYTRRVGGSITEDGNWIIPTVFAGAAYEGRFDVTSGTLNLGGSAATATWLPLSSSYFWGRSSGAGVSATVTGTMQIRRASDLVVLASVSCTIIADGT